MAPPALALSAPHRSRIAAAATAAHPEECCGVLLGRSGEDGINSVERVWPAPNISRADRRHHFEIDPTVILQAWELARSNGWTLVGFYHSHPEGGRRPSRADERNAWPDVSYLIVPRQGAMASWRRRSGGGFVAEALTEPAVSRVPVGSA